MKVNEAPKKIYLFENPISETPDDRWLSKRSCDEDVEYIRTDAFIEKACEWLKGKVDIPFSVETNEKGELNADSYIDYATKRLEAENKFLEDFKNAMRR